MSTREKTQNKKQKKLLPLLAIGTSILLNTFLWTFLAIQIFKENRKKMLLVNGTKKNNPLIPWKDSPMKVIMDLSMPGNPIAPNKPLNTAPRTIETCKQEQNAIPQQTTQQEKIVQKASENICAKNMHKTIFEPNQEEGPLSKTEKNLKERALQVLLKKDIPIKKVQTKRISNPMQEWKQTLETKAQTTLKNLGAALGTSDDIRFISIRKRLKEHFMASLGIALRHSSFVVKKAVREGRNPYFDVIINADGTIARLGVAQSSGCDALDELVLRAIETAAPFPQLPKHLGIDRYPLAGAIFD
ncbi:energy transducer TonB [Candidatus Babeliales bacterium]|nr:energy transducer TonB [Candidatus Babeliales bacterium]